MYILSFRKISGYVGFSNKSFVLEPMRERWTKRTLSRVDGIHRRRETVSCSKMECRFLVSHLSLNSEAYVFQHYLIFMEISVSAYLKQE